MHAFALGWDVMVYRGHLVYDKPGGYMGVTSQVVFLPEGDLGLVLFANLRSQMAYWIVTAEILDRLLGLEPLPYVDRYWSQEENYIQRIVENLHPISAPEDASDPSLPLDEFTGTYRNEGYGELTIGMENGRLRIDYLEDTTMMHHDGNTFQAFQLYQYWLFEFITGPGGEVIGLSVPFESKVPDIEFGKVSD